ncbi:MAG: 3'-5' exonuclease [Spirochaetaceae bacterium]|nr:3'-5' exonuclease [Spirochaetaceae bacterium]
MRRRSRAFETATAKTWAHHLTQRDDWLVIDVETTGLGLQAEVVEAAIIGSRGDVLLDTVVRPHTPLEPQASRVHGLDVEALRDRPRFGQIHGKLMKLLTRRTVVAYHAEFDRHVLAHTCRAAGLPQIECTWECAMLRYEQWRGFRASLATVCEVESIVAAGPRHRALPDARLVWNLIRRMAGESA